MYAVNLLQWPKVVLFGDSLTQFSFSASGYWGSQLADTLQRKCDILNRGFSGYNSKWNAIMLPRLITKHDVTSIAAFIIFLGANDSNLPEGVQHVPIGIHENKIILIGPPPCVDEAWMETQKKKGTISTQSNVYKEQYALGCKDAASTTGATFVDLYYTMMKEPNWHNFLEDGLHFSKSGSDFVASLLQPHILSLTEKLPEIMPLWKDVNPKNPEESLLHKE